MVKLSRLLRILRRGLAERHRETLLPIFRMQEKLVLVKLHSFFEIFMSNDIIQIIMVHTNEEIGRKIVNLSSEWYKRPIDDIEVK